ncbi:hypothetical protein [Candidatus Nitrosopumilus sediminis]|uniref:hypothetical protein n=1 Tax=Candidatus Nitrosopumilus sediminis TaxID=1229909 RepID=UPI0012FE8FC4|nr:hypothetical protein [Candidatus Nitrosopumilus sediminis]
MEESCCIIMWNERRRKEISNLKQLSMPRHKKTYYAFAGGLLVIAIVMTLW